MPPIRLVGLGFFVAILSIRIGGFDVSVDALGWLLVGLALGAVAGLNAWLRAAHALAWVTALLSCAQLIPGLTRNDFALGAYNVAFSIVVICVARGLRYQARSGRDWGVGLQAQIIAWTTGVSATFLYFGYLLDSLGVTDVEAMVVSMLVIGFLTLVWATVLLVMVGGRAYVLPGPAERHQE